MDYRWEPVPLDSFRSVKVLLHKTASIGEVRRGEAVDPVDLSPMMSQGKQSCFDVNITLNWNYELFGAENQPAPNHVLEIQLMQAGLFVTLWIGIVESVSSFTISRGERSMQLTAKSRDSLDIFRTAKRVTALFPQLTDMAYIAGKIAKSAGLDDDEIVLPISGMTTSHTNTQLADMSAWDMLTNLFLPLSWTPFMDGQGRLKAASRDVQGAIADVVLEPERVVKVVAQRQRPPATRLKVKWLDPTLKKSLQQGRKLADQTMTTGWFLPFLKKTIYFSDDKTQRAVNTYMVTKQSANALFVPVCLERYEQLEQNKGKITLINLAWGPAIITLLVQWQAAHSTPDGVSGPNTVPVGRKLEGYAQLAFMLIMMSIGTGIYEIWGTPYEWVHARNTTEAFDSSAPRWVDNPVEVETDFIINEQHAQAVAVRELIYQAKSANKWAVSLVDDPRIEFGDILEFPDESKMYVEDVSRSIMRGDPAVMEIKGFLI